MKDAFFAMQQLLQNSGSGEVGSSQGGVQKLQNPRSTDLVAYGKALVSGVLETVQDSAKDVLREIQAARGRSQPPLQSGEGAAVSITASISAGRSTGSKPVGSLINTTA
jgi:hypothetical protein